MSNASAKLLKILILAAILFQSLNLPAQFMDRRTQRQLDEKIRESKVFSQYFTGFALFDPAKDAMLYQKDAFKYFTPASNTKLFTLYTALKILGDSMPVLRYGYRDQLLVVQGTGNPLFFHPDFEDNAQGWDILKQAKNLMLYSEDNYRDDHFGPGWSWADYQYAYQVEKSPFPIHGNFARIFRDSGETQINTQPAYFARFLRPAPAGGGAYPRIQREETGDYFFYNESALNGRPFSVEVPYNQSPNAVCGLLSDTLGIRVMPASEIPGPLPAFTTVYAPLPDTLLQRFMQESDNYLAEQLLLMCSAKLSDTLNTEAVIEYAKKNLFQGLPPDTLNWADGSGLSRYNLFTPRTIVALLHKLYQEVPQERLFRILATGGKSGTIRSWYGGKAEPYVFAKTGTLANQHCLSGFVKTKKGRTLIFSFMHNNFNGSATPIRTEMQSVLEWIWEYL